MSDRRICKTCKFIKSRIPDGKFANGKMKKFRDETGALWNGSVCPSCNTARLKEVMKNKRSKIIIKSENGSEIHFDIVPDEDPLKGS